MKKTDGFICSYCYISVSWCCNLQIMKSRTTKHRQEVSSRNPIERSKQSKNKRGVIWSLVLVFLLLLLLVVLYFFFN